MVNNLRRKVLGDLKGIQKTSADAKLTAKKLEGLIKTRKVEPTKGTVIVTGHARAAIIRANAQLKKETAHLIANARK